MPDTPMAEDVTPGPAAALLIADKVRCDQLHLLFRQSFSAVFGSYVAAALLSWLQWTRSDHGTITIWLLLLGGSSVLRLAMFLRYFRTSPSQRTPQRWNQPYWLTLVLSAGIWGVGALLVMPKDNLLSQAITLFFTIGMAGSAISTYSANRWMTLSAIGLVLLPTTLWLLVQPTFTQQTLAGTALLFALAVSRSTGQLSGALQTAFRLNHEMELAHGIVSRAAQTDELTGINNRRAFFERAEQLLSYCKRHQRPLSVLVMDIDHFKQINDTHGHHTGDDVLRQVGALLHAKFREADVCGRLGGEEFAVLLADTAAPAARAVAETLRQAMADLALTLPQNQTLHLTASLGVATVGPGCDELRILLHQADTAMYQAKANGRNQVVAA